MSKIIIGYDPGGANANGISFLELTESNKIGKFGHACVSNYGEALAWLFGNQKINPEDVIGAGIDSFLSWPIIETFRPMDSFLRAKYSKVRDSVFAANSARGSMMQGIEFADVLKLIAPNLILLNETHPKVAYYAQTRRKHDYYILDANKSSKPDKNQESSATTSKKTFNQKNAKRMWRDLQTWIEDSSVNKPLTRVTSSIPNTDHEWDALYSAWFTYQYGITTPGTNLMQLKEESDLTSLNISNKQVEYIDSLRKLSDHHEGTGQLANLFEQRILVRDSIKDKVTYYWFPASETK